MTPTQTQQQLAKLRQAIAKFQTLRARTNKAIEGKPELAATVAQMRDDAKEREVVEALVDLNRLILQRDPSAEELQTGVPGDEALGILPLLPLVAIGGGAWSLSSIFGYLSDREQRIQRQLGMTSSWSDVLGNVSSWIMPLIVVGGVGFGGFYLYKKFLKKETGRGTRRPPKGRVSGRTGRLKSLPEKKE